MMLCMNYFVYIIRCRDDSLYTGITTDLKRRIDEHNGKYEGGAKYTAGRRPVELIYSQKFNNRSEAGKEEWRIKSMKRKQKEALIKNYGK